MASSLMRQFIASGFEPIEVDGEPVYPMYTTSIEEGDCVRVRWVSAASPNVQGLGLRLRILERKGRKGEGGLLRVEGVEAPTIVLWMDTAPPVVKAECVKLADHAVLRVSNRWRLPDGREDEWLNNFGMKVEPVGERSVLLHCSDGYGVAPSFDDLVVQVDVNSSR